MNRSRELAQQLLQRARDDQHVLELLVNDPQAAAWTVGFHAQQAVEKAVKAVLSVAGIEYPRTHNLVLLLGLLKGSQPPDADELAHLTPYGVLMRYDATSIGEGLEPLDRTWASACVRRTVAWAASVLGQEKEKGR